MNRDQIQRQIQAISNEITCMNPKYIEDKIKNNEFKITFDHFCWTEEAKIQTEIKITKTLINDK